MSQGTVSDALIIFLLTLCPLKAIIPFAQLTHGSGPVFRRNLAWRATAVAIASAIIVALSGSVVLGNWNVSVIAIVIAGSIILFCQGCRLVTQRAIESEGSLNCQKLKPWRNSAKAVKFFFE
jgi:multiple antibiotic resistance protein